MRRPPRAPSPPGRSCSPLTALTPSPPAYICSNQIMGWGEKAIEIRSVETGHLDGVFMHKRAQRLKFLCERNDKVGAPVLARAGRGVFLEGSWGHSRQRSLPFPGLPFLGAPLLPRLLPVVAGCLSPRISDCVPQFPAVPPPAPSNRDPPQPSVPTCPAPQVFFASVRSGGSSQVYFMTLNRNCIMNW